MRIKPYKPLCLLLICALLISSVSLTGCTNKKKAKKTINPSPTSTTQATEDCDGGSEDQITVSSLKEKYEETEDYIYTEPIYNASPKDYIHQISLDFSAEGFSDEQLRKIVNVYTDAKLQNTADPVLEYDDDSQTILVKPNKWGILPVIDEPGFEEEEYSSWGNVSKLYFSLNIDPKTGERLKKPVVTVVTFTNGLQAPTAAFEVLDDGRPGISWSPVEGATKYMVCYTLYYDAFTHNEDGSISISEYGIDQVTATQCIFKLAETTDTRYEDIYEAEQGDYVSSMNFLAAVDSDLQKGFCIIALDENNHSLSSNILKIKSLLPELPSTCHFTVSDTYKDPSQVPFTSNVSMVSGDTVLKYPRVIDFTPVMQEAQKQAEVESSYCYVTVPYRVKGTSFSGSFSMEGTSEDIVSKIEQLQKRYQEESYTSAVATPDMNLPDTPPSNVTSPDSPVVDPEDVENTDQEYIDMPDIPITASNSLSAYLASQMLLGKTSISLNDFTEASNVEYLSDCIFEAVYQNPLILNTKSFRLDYETNSLLVEYQSIDASTMAAKQKEIMEAVAKITNQIITEGMSDLEKETAINTYICDTAEYDDAACEHAMANNMTIVDPKYLDSFNPYGILINKVGVCASYAASFKLLADAADIETIVVTGKLNGTIPHAWNRVKIENEWYSVDSTNNDNESIPNALFNLSDEEASSVLVEDVDFVCDNTLENYKASGNNYEFYRLNKKYFESSDITGIAKSITNTQGFNVFRTDYNITSEEAKSIIEDALTKNNYTGTYRYQVFLGVVVLALEN